MDTKHERCYWVLVEVIELMSSLHRAFIWEIVSMSQQRVNMGTQTLFLQSSQGNTDEKYFHCIHMF